jgi:hypothetical protein
MSATLSTARPATAGRSAALTAARAVFGAAGAVKLSGAVYFSFVASAAEGGDPHGWFDWSVVVWSHALALAFLVLAVRLRPGAPVRAGAGLLLVEVAFSLVKLTVYGESAALAFIAVDAVLLVLLALSRRSRAA